MKHRIQEFIQKYHITPIKLLVLLVVILSFIARFLIHDEISTKLLHSIIGLYAHFLMAISRLFLLFSKNGILFDFVKDQIVSSGHILRIDRFYFSSSQILAALGVVFITKSPLQNKTLLFMAAFMALSLYNSIRIALHAVYPETVSIHNWFFNLVLIPRWLIVLGFAWYYWKKFPSFIDFIKKKFGFDDKFIRRLFLKIALIIVVYYFVVIFIFNDLIFLNGSLFISFILNASKFFIQLLGYDCWISNRLIYGKIASLYMDDACMGINLMFLFASFIALMPGAFKHKMWYIPLGLTVIVLLNCIRIVLIFINVTKSGRYDLFLEIHDLFTYPVLVFTFFMWMIWINRFLKPKKEISENRIS